MMGDGCIFCAIVAGEAPSRTIYEDGEAVAFLDINPVTRGHVLVVPRRHWADMWDVPEDDATAVMRAGWHVTRMVQRALEPAGVNLFQATRAIAGQTVFHLHLHVLPRYDPTELTISLSRGPGDPDDMDAVAAALTRAG
jgi:histidine triad (HIT) family protein